MQPESALKGDAGSLTRRKMNMEKISKQNLKALESIKRIIEIEEERDVTLDQTLDRVLSHYRTHVPFG